MINRRQPFAAQPPTTARFTDYYAVEALGDTYIVSFATALYVERQLELLGALDTIEFADVFGVTRRLAAIYIHRITEASLGAGAHGKGCCFGATGAVRGIASRPIW